MALVDEAVLLVDWLNLSIHLKNLRLSFGADLVSGLMARIRPVISMPSISGMLKSVMTIAAGRPWKSSSPARPLSAVATANWGYLLARMIARH